MIRKGRLAIVNMKVGMGFSGGVGVAMRMDEVGTFEQRSVVQELIGLAFGDEVSGLKDDAAVGDVAPSQRDAALVAHGRAVEDDPADVGRAEIERE